MTEKELKQLFYLKKEIARLQKQLKELKHFYGYNSSLLSNMPKAKCQKDKIAEYVAQLGELEELIRVNLRRSELERAKLERYISNIEDAEIRLIFRLRHISGMTWESIGEEINYTKSGVFKKYKRYLKSVNKFNKDV